MASAPPSRVARGVDDERIRCVREVITSAVLRFHVKGPQQHVYSVQFVHDKTVTCTCPDFRSRRASCKHILWTLIFKLRVPEDEACDLLGRAGAVQRSHGVWRAVAEYSDDTSDARRKRDCAVCTEEAVAPTVPCSRCPSSLHGACFEELRGTAYGELCPSCSTPWPAAPSSAAPKRPADAPPQAAPAAKKARHGAPRTRAVRMRRRGGVVVQDCDVYVGRACFMGGWKLAASEWANPFSVKECKTAEEAVRRFREYLLGKPALLARVGELRGKTLGCWCKPGPCHADVLAEFADAQ